MARGSIGRFAGKTAFVTGAGAGLGAAFSRVLAASGAHVVVADVNADKAEITARAIGAEAMALDVREPERIAQALQATRRKYGSLDVVINNAGVTAGGEPLDLLWSDWTGVIQVNLLGVIAGSIEALRIMKEQGSGWILNMGSTNGLALTPMLGPYSASKAGVVLFSRGLAEEAKGFGVHVSVGCPGNIRTAILPGNVSRLMPPMDPDVAARKLLDGMLRRRRVIVFPFYARAWWWADRIHTELLAPFRQEIVRRARVRNDAARHVN
ncbi:MAG: SDR family NAD(P)-dependent oxidoreductase [Terracidiphilus sp.]|nr:SDR family NAD(P)-dependent oxidoreductase [Terracidiphilus sp.]